MNIFAVSSNPAECARALDDRRVNKMTTETAQLLSDALLNNGLAPFMKRNNPNHPLVKWVGKNYQTFLWTIILLEALQNEFCLRYKKPQGHQHRAFARAYDICKLQAPDLPEPDYDVLTIQMSFHNSSLYKNEPDVHKAYRQTMIYKWRNYKGKETSTRWAPTWTNVKPPSWADDEIPELET